jgi:monooxygenase
VTTATGHVDVLIIGAGLSGIGAAHHIQSAFPGRTYTILEARDSIGGTWDLFRYPGVRSDSDMYTLGYRFRPWTEPKAIADGPAILHYIRETAAAAGIDRHIRFRHRVVRAEWSSEDARWTIDAVHDGEPVRLTAGFLYACSGYYRYDGGHAPHFPGIDRFGGTVVHPQHWPEDLDYTGKRVVVIGSGATAVTLVPAMADRAAHVTMLQRSPTYIISLPAEDAIANGLRRLLGDRGAYPIARWKNVALQTLFYRLSRRRPNLVRSLIRKGTIKLLPSGYDVDTHFNPDYQPWDQRLCLVPDGDLFAAIRAGRASVVTDHIEEFTGTGVRLRSGADLQADVVVTATGLRLLALGGVTLAVDGREVKLPETMVYKGVMLSGVPNFAFTIGYTNASWTLKADLVSEYVVRLLRHMDAHGYDQGVPMGHDDPTVTERPLLDFQAGYVLRSIDEFPRAGSRPPWQVQMSYPHDLRTLRRGSIDDGILRFSRRPAAREAVPRSA